MKSLIALIYLAAPAVWAADVTPMNLKIGQWETTVVNQVSGAPQAARAMPPIPADKLAQLPPEQRARIEAMLANAGGGGRPIVTKTCITKEKLSQMQADEASSRPNCKNTVITYTTTKQVVQSECEIAGVKRLSTATFEATGQDSMKFTIVSNPDTSASAAANPAASVSVNISGTSKWLGPTCTESK